MSSVIKENCSSESKSGSISNEYLQNNDSEIITRKQFVRTSVIAVNPPIMSLALRVASSMARLSKIDTPHVINVAMSLGANETIGEEKK